ncbi:transferase [Pseudomonas fluorescens]|uniref:Transferase n=1 Tax=Pseudomonas fluorescens TaxID=294 RepID=A0A345URM1_PSEFL|nr:DapH/DapD/GlmU-related protein [Pseudomonas fluorescens]AXJ03123.1 transferase [Pseudomonas fluorescens]WJK10668.1 DapH/DapD/GlmU-related protein [Pseudomonas fluorescens]
MDDINVIEVSTIVDSASELGRNVWVRAGSRLTNVQISDDCFIGFRCDLQHASIGKSSMFATGAQCLGTAQAPVRIAENVWLGAKATVAAGVSIGAGAVVAAGALVTADVPPDAIVVGRPARVIAQRTVVEDGRPSPEPVLAKVRERARQGLPSMLDRSTQSVARLKSLNPDTLTWDINDDVLIDAELRGGASVEIARDCILIGRSNRQGGMSQLGGIELGTGARLAAGVVIEAAGGVSVGPFSELSEGVTIVASTHDHSFRSLPWEEAPVRIGSRCVIGEGAILVGPLNIGDGAVIKPYSVVIRDVLENTVVHGVVQLMEIQE